MLHRHGGRERRRRWSVEEKLRIVGKSHERSACVRAVGARHAVYPSMLHDRRRQVREGRLGSIEATRFVPVRLTETSPAVGVASSPLNRQSVTDTIEIVLPDGCCLRVGNDVSLAALRRVMTALHG